MFPFKIEHPANNISVITDDGSSFTYGDSDEFRQTIRKLIPSRCLLFCLAQNTIGSFSGYVSFLSSSVVPLMLDPNTDIMFLKTLIADYRPQYLWLPDCRADEFKEYAVIFSKYNYCLVKLEAKNHFDLHPNLAILLTTSGSTGSSKLIRISYDNLKTNAEAIVSYLSIDEYERPITVLPFWYSYGISVINSHLLKGATLLLTTKSVVEKDFWSFFKSHNASSLSGVPYTFHILKKIKFHNMELPSLKTLTVAGGKLNDDLNRYISEYAFNSHRRFFVMYGQTEATARMSYLHPDYALKKSGSIGHPIPGGEFNLIDDKGNKIQENGVTGELVYKGKNVSMGYSFSGDDLIKSDENKGILYTGDLAKRDEDGFYYITGRKNRFIKLFGNRISLDETEHLLSQIIPECACYGNDDQLRIFITDRSRVEEIKNYISSATGIHAGAFSVEYRDEIPKNAAGKINYSILGNV